MLISHKHQFIFVRCRKTASTSTEIHLSRYLGDEDVITSFCDRDERLRASAGGRPPQNLTAPNGVEFFNHMPAAEVRAAVGECWDRYYKFCFERNPWDKVISLYFHRHKSEPRISFDEFLESREALDARNAPLYMIEGAVAVDKVGRYERLHEDLADFCGTIGVPAPLSLEQAKSQFRLDRRHYREFLTREQSRFIADAFADEIAIHGYCY